jgi:CBS-domain-containing membrane protein
MYVESPADDIESRSDSKAATRDKSVTTCLISDLEIIHIPSVKETKRPESIDVAKDASILSMRNEVKLHLVAYARKFICAPRKLKTYGFQLDAECIASLVISFVGMLVISRIDFEIEDSDYVMLIGSFGATAVLLYAAYSAPLAQPRSVLGGHVLSAIIGVAVQKALGHTSWIAAPLSVSLSIFVMQCTGTLHPPGGATALIAVTGSAKIHALGFEYVFIPVASGASIMLIIALLLNNLSPFRKYPTFWW